MYLHWMGLSGLLHTTAKSLPNSILVSILTRPVRFTVYVAEMKIALSSRSITLKQWNRTPGLK
jgi:hypothetical protein